jgi:hypothetical protein
MVVSVSRIVEITYPSVLTCILIAISKIYRFGNLEKRFLLSEKSSKYYLNEQIFIHHSIDISQFC